MEIGDIVILKEDRTIDFINGSQNITLSYANDIIPIVRIRNEKLKQILDEI